MALLDLVNQLRDLLREQRVSSVSGSNPELMIEIGLVNRAARNVLMRHPWSFLQRSDGSLFFPARVEGTSGSFTQGSTTANLGLTSGSSGQAAAFSDGSLAAKVVRPDDSRFPNTSYRVTNLQTTGSTQATFSSAYRGDTANPADFVIYANQARFPSDVSNIISIKNEEDVSISFDTIPTFAEFDRLFPHETLQFQEFPSQVAVGGQVVPTSQDGGSTTPGIGIRFYPPNTSDLLLLYSYVRRPETLAADADELVGVPSEVKDLIVQVAFEIANRGNIEDNPDKADSLLRSNELTFRELVEADRRDIGRRHVLQPFGASRAVNPDAWIRSIQSS